MRFRSATRPRRLTKKTTGGCCGILAVMIFIAVVASMVSGHSGAQQAVSTPTATSAAIVAASSPTHAATVTPAARATTAPKTTPVVKATPQPTHQATPRPTPTHPACSNPWCYSFSGSVLIYTPPGNFCSYFNCIASFWGSDDPGDGYIVQCADGLFSQSGGERGACSSHGGVSRPLYSQ